LPVLYERASLAAWDLQTPKSAFDSLARNLAQGIDTKATTIKIRTDLNLTVEAFSRLVEIRTKDNLANNTNDPRNPRVEDAEWAEAFSILAQARKSSFYPTWIAEETGLLFGPEEFWISLREPAQGDWPPLISTEQPLIDPQNVNLKDLPEPTAGAQAIRRWEDRRDQLDQIRTDLKSEREREGGGFQSMLQLAIGDPNQSDPLPVVLDNLLANLNSADENIAGDARTTIEGLLFMSVDDFKRLMQIRAEDAQNDASKKPTAAEYELSEEGPPTREYWTLLKAKLPRWRASAEARATWQRSLRIRSSAPIVDPDLIGPGDIEKLFGSDPAFTLWQARRDAVNGYKENSLRKLREQNPSARAAFDSIFETAVGVPGTEIVVLDGSLEGWISSASLVTRSCG
jgi:hypothetical protein